MTKHEEFIKELKWNIENDKKRYYELLGSNGICKVTNKLAARIEKHENLLIEMERN